MKALLDTHTVSCGRFLETVNSLDGQGRCSPVQSGLWLSVASIWEVLIKARWKNPFAQANWSVSCRKAIRKPDGEIAHNVGPCLKIESLAIDHRDPFDWMLVAQRMEENCLWSLQILSLSNTVST